MIVSRRHALLALGGLAGAACGPAPPPPALVAPPRPRPRPAPVPPWPTRRPDALGGTAFLERIRDLVGPLREDRILAELEEGNVPSFMRGFVALPLSTAGAEPPASRGAQAWALPDYLCVGSDHDFLRVPMLAPTAQRIADALGCVLPTPRLVDTVFRHARHLPPVALEAGPLMVSSDAYRLQDERVEAARRRLGIRLGALVAGHKKDIVVSARLSPGRLAIYGFHRESGEPVQPLSLVHSTKYVDYAQGVRLVHGAVRLEGAERAVADVLADGATAHWLSDEGAFAMPRYG